MLTLIPKGYCSEGKFDFSGIPEQLAIKLNVPLFASQVLCSAIIIFIPLLLVSMLGGKSKHGWIAELFIGIMFSCFCIAIGWLPVYILILTVLIVAIAFSDKLSTVFTK
jgi:hypothetical protein